MNNAKVFEKKLTIPTYSVGEEEKNPMFFEKRVYQGSSGKVYPNHVIEKISDDKVNKVYNAVYLENDWLTVIVLPELGGRIYTAYDKTNGYDFVYHNHVIKPALVGLLGPWISGGIEFNWPQHHRPTTYMPVNYSLKQNNDGSASVFVGESEAMFGLKHTTEIKLYADKSYIEINTDVYNRGEMTQTFLWWANPAYKVNDETVTIMPQDVSAVMDHGKRAVSTFPIATGEYYKMDYSTGVDISRYKNIPVPTSFMAYKSDFDFVGGYDYSRNAGLLHVADHHIAPGKKQWTWGCGDFGKAWDRNLTDEDGPYVELMTGCFTDNQPDFTFIKPHETKSFTQYFMPYHNVGRILNADKNICYGIENGKLTVYSSSEVCGNISVNVNGNQILSQQINLLPTQSVEFDIGCEKADIAVAYSSKTLAYSDKEVKKFDVPKPAEACPQPKDCKTTEELYLFGTHIEQYRHATRLAEDYYLEALRRDSGDIRNNNAYGKLLLRRGMTEESIEYFERAVEKCTVKNSNPQDTEIYYNAGLAYFIIKKYGKAYDLFYKCVWGNCKNEALYYLSVIDKIQGRYDEAIEHAKEAVLLQGRDTRALNTLGRLYNDADDGIKARDCFERAAALDVLDAISGFELQIDNALNKLSPSDVRILAADYLCEQRFDKLIEFLTAWQIQSNLNDSMIELYIAYAELKSGKDCACRIVLAEKLFDNKSAYAINLTDIEVLKELYNHYKSYIIAYQLGNLYYDKRCYDKAAEYWKACAELNLKFPTARRNLALYYYNKIGDKQLSFKYMEEAYMLDESDARVLLELFELYELCGKNSEEKFKLLSLRLNIVEKRDDLYLEYLKLLEERGEFAEAYGLMMNRKFHPWEGGEGKVTKLYKKLNINLAKSASDKGDYELAKIIYERCFHYPNNLGEGKLILDYDNDVCYLLGELSEKFGHFKAANDYYLMATRGNNSVADDMYYNDNPIEYVFYAALAYRKLGLNDMADNIKNDLNEYYNNHVDKLSVIDYFAVSLPDMLIWEQDINVRNSEFCKTIKDMADKL